MGTRSRALGALGIAVSAGLSVSWALAPAALAASTGPVAPGSTQLVTRTPSGGAPRTQIGVDAMELGGDVSGDGRFVAYESVYPTIVKNDTNYVSDVFLHDTVAQTTTAVSRTGAGGTGNASSGAPLISRDGRYVVFGSRATNLVGVAQSTSAPRYYRYDTSTQRLTVIDRPTLGRPVALSSTGQYVVYEGGAAGKVYRVDVTTNTVALVSRTPNGGAPNGASDGAVISGTGRFVVYRSNATNLVTGAATAPGIYRWDAQTGATILLRRAPAGQDAYTGLQVSDDGNTVAFNGYPTSPEAQTLPDSPTNALGYLYRLDVPTGTLRQVDPGFSGSVRLDFDYWTIAARAFESSMSADGRYLAFLFRYEDATGRQHDDVVRYDNASGRTSVVQADAVYTDYQDGPSNIIQRVEISADGRNVLFVHSRNGSSTVSHDYLWTSA